MPAECRVPSAESAGMNICLARSHGIYPVLVESRYFLSGTASVYS